MHRNSEIIWQGLVAPAVLIKGGLMEHSCGGRSRPDSAQGLLKPVQPHLKLRKGKDKQQSRDIPPTPSMAALRCTGRALLARPAEGSDESRVQDEPTGHRRKLLRAIPLPVDQVLQTVPPATDAQDAANSINRMPIHQPGGWRGTGRRAQRAGRHRLKQGHVESGMYTEGGREFEADRGGTDNHVRAHRLGGQFLGGGFQGNVFGRQPNLLSRCVMQGRDAASIGQTAIVFSCAPQSHMSPNPHTTDLLEMMLNRGDLKLPLLLRKQGRLITQGSLERGAAGGRGVVSVLNPSQMPAPGGGTVRSHTMESGLQLLI
ncbi:uncharacterized protein LOC121645886 [Melanotaenia boesemani]|uniref:uncharacterized protein LOC121645886 n=1 Tax=Melanotaenia boesemani TaxID=1250792 RepID=UPI001C048787|nr:uncharacterized protein LOC121645886 [Melanotaenia boesemani]